MTETFIRVTNKDIYNEIKEIHKEIKELKEENKEQHNVIIEHQMKTNGKVILNKWIATTAITISLIVLGFLVNYMINKGG